MNDDLWGLVGIGIVLASAVGWVMNIVAVAQSEFVNGMVILRVVGIFIAPLGSVLGYL